MLAKLVAYRKAPMLTFVILHPIRAIKWGAALFLLQKLWGSRDGERTSSARVDVR